MSESHLNVDLHLVVGAVSFLTKARSRLCYHSQREGRTTGSFLLPLVHTSASAAWTERLWLTPRERVRPPSAPRSVKSNVSPPGASGFQGEWLQNMSPKLSSSSGRVAFGILLTPKRCHHEMLSERRCSCQNSLGRPHNTEPNKTPILFHKNTQDFHFARPSAI